MNDRTILGAVVPGRKKILFVARELPRTNSDGGSTYTLGIIKYLREAGYEIRLSITGEISARSWICRADPDKLRVAQIAMRGRIRLGATLFFGKPQNYARKIVKRVLKFARQLFGKSVPAGESELWAVPASNEERSYIQEQISAFQPNIVIVNFVFLTDVLKSTSQGTSSYKKVLLAHEVLHERIESYARLGKESGHWQWTSENESCAWKSYDEIIAIQSENALTISRLVPASRVTCVPLAVSVAPSSSSFRRGSCLFVGSAASHNVHSLNWFLDHVWPLVVQQLPDSVLRVCGNVCSEISKAAPNITLVGRVEDLSSEYHSAQVCIIPLVVGGGLKIKLIEALAHGCPCISTSIGIQGVPELIEQAVSVADTSEAFARELCRGLSDLSLRDRMAKSAIEYVQTHFVDEIVYRPLLECLERA